MDLIAVLARVVLIGTFVLSAVAKAVDQPGTRATAHSLGVPDRLAGPCAAALVAIEGALALGLVPGSTVVVAALGLVVLLALFSATIAANLARDNRPDCGCFGPLTRGSIGPATLARNGMLAVLALVVVATAEDGLARAIAELDAVALITGFVVLGGLAVLLRQRGTTRAAIAPLIGAPAPGGLQPDDIAPSFTVLDLDGGTTTLEDLLDRGSSVLLVFASTTCGACGSVLAQLSTWQAVGQDQLTIAFLIAGPTESAKAVGERYGLHGVALDTDSDVAHAYRLTATPAAALVGSDRRLAARIAHGGGEVFNLLLEGLGLREVVQSHLDAYEGGSDRDEGPNLIPEHIELATVPRPRASVLLLEPAGEPVLLDREDGAVALINNPASIIWRCFDGRSSLDEIARDISDVFGVETAIAQDDVVRTARHLAELGMLAGTADLDAELLPDRPTVT